MDVTFVSSSFVVPFFNVFLNEVVYQVGEQVSHSWWYVVPLLLADEGGERVVTFDGLITLVFPLVAITVLFEVIF